MSYTYNQYIVNLANMLVVSTTDTGYVTALPSIIDDAEQRVYRELDLLNTVFSDTTGIFVTNTRSVNLPASNGTFYAVNTIYAITPVTSNPNTVGALRNPLIPVSRDYLDFTWPSVTGSTVPAYFAMTTQTSIIVGPWPDQAYTFEVNGTLRPTPLALTNQTTLLTAYLPDLFFAASMVFGAAYQQNFAATADNPQMSQTWETHYQALKQSAQVEEWRKKFNAEGWSSKQPSQIVTPPRT